jgi:hypothetical protein
VSASSEDDRTTSLQRHVITSDTTISVDSILEHSAMKHFAGQLHAKQTPLHSGHISNRINYSSSDMRIYFNVISV